MRFSSLLIPALLCMGLAASDFERDVDINTVHFEWSPTYLFRPSSETLCGGSAPTADQEIRTFLGVQSSSLYKVNRYNILGAYLYVYVRIIDGRATIKLKSISKSDLPFDEEQSWNTGEPDAGSTYYSGIRISNTGWNKLDVTDIIKYYGGESGGEDWMGVAIYPDDSSRVWKIEFDSYMASHEPYILFQMRPRPMAPSLSYPLQANSGVTYRISNTHVGVQWYEYQESTRPDFAGAITVKTTGKYIDCTKNITSDTIYYYRVRGIGDSSNGFWDDYNGDWSSTAQVLVKAPSITLCGPGSVIGGNSVALSWTGNAASYQLQGSYSQDFSSFFLGFSTASNGYQFYSANSNYSMFFRVRIAPDGNWSNTLRVDVSKRPNTAPSISVNNLLSEVTPGVFLTPKVSVSDPDGDPVGWQVDIECVDDGVGFCPADKNAFCLPYTGTFFVTFTATDNSGASCSVQRYIECIDPEEFNALDQPYASDVFESYFAAFLGFFFSKHPLHTLKQQFVIDMLDKLGSGKIITQQLTNLGWVRRGNKMQFPSGDGNIILDTSEYTVKVGLSAKEVDGAWEIAHRMIIADKNPPIKFLSKLENGNYIRWELMDMRNLYMKIGDLPRVASQDLLSNNVPMTSIDGAEYWLFRDPALGRPGLSQIRAGNGGHVEIGRTTLGEIAQKGTKVDIYGPTASGGTSEMVADAENFFSTINSNVVRRPYDGFTIQGKPNQAMEILLKHRLESNLPIEARTLHINKQFISDVEAWRGTNGYFKDASKLKNLVVRFEESIGSNTIFRELTKDSKPLLSELLVALKGTRVKIFVTRAGKILGVAGAVVGIYLMFADLYASFQEQDAFLHCDVAGYAASAVLTTGTLSVGGKTIQACVARVPSPWGKAACVVLVGAATFLTSWFVAEESYEVPKDTCVDFTRLQLENLEIEDPGALIDALGYRGYYGVLVSGNQPSSDPYGESCQPEDQNPQNQIEEASPEEQAVKTLKQNFNLDWYWFLIEAKPLTAKKWRLLTPSGEELGLGLGKMRTKFSLLDYADTSGQWVFKALATRNVIKKAVLSRRGILSLSGKKPEGMLYMVIKMDMKTSEGETMKLGLLPIRISSGRAAETKAGSMGGQP